MADLQMADEEADEVSVKHLNAAEEESIHGAAEASIDIKTQGEDGEAQGGKTLDNDLPTQASIENII